MTKPRTGKLTSAEYQRQYRLRKKLDTLTCQTNWMLDVRLVNAIRAKAQDRQVRESVLVQEILTAWYEKEFGQKLASVQEGKKDFGLEAGAEPMPETELRSTVMARHVISVLTNLGVHVPVEGRIEQYLRGDDWQGLKAQVTVERGNYIELEVKERTAGQDGQVWQWCINAAQMEVSVPSVFHDIKETIRVSGVDDERYLQIIRQIKDRVLPTSQEVSFLDIFVQIGHALKNSAQSHAFKSDLLRAGFGLLEVTDDGLAAIEYKNTPLLQHDLMGVLQAMRACAKKHGADKLFVKVSMGLEFHFEVIDKELNVKKKSHTKHLSVSVDQLYTFKKPA